MHNKYCILNNLPFIYVPIDRRTACACCSEIYVSDSGKVIIWDTGENMADALFVVLRKVALSLGEGVLESIGREVAEVAPILTDFEHGMKQIEGECHSYWACVPLWADKPCIVGPEARLIYVSTREPGRGHRTRQ